MKIFKVSYMMVVCLVLIGQAADVNFQATLEECQEFAKKFANTCDAANSPTSISSTTSASQTCDSDTLYGKCGFTTIAAETVTNVHPIQCQHNRKLCVTCSENAAKKVEIRVQTNSLPNHCYFSNITTMKAINIDFTVVFQPTQWGADTDQKDVMFESDLNKVICNKDKQDDSNIPTQASFKDNIARGYDDIWGVSITGVPFQSSIDFYSEDNVYPRRDWDDQTDGSSVYHLYDDCMGQVHNATGMYFYNTPSNCIADSSVTWSGKYNNSDINETIRAAWARKDRTPIGISKDGRVIYSPTYSAGTVYDDCDVDICNGIMISG